MKILALHLGHNSTAAIAVSGRILAMVSEEKFDDVKNSAAFPRQAISYCMSHAGLEPAELDGVVIAGQEIFPARAYDYLFAPPTPGAGGTLRKVVAGVERSPLAFMAAPALNAVRSRRQGSMLDEGEAELASNLASVGLDGVPLSRVEHHTCHARAAYHALDDSDQSEPALILTLDGSGDGIAGSVCTAAPDGTWTRHATVPVSASLGGFYSNTTKFLGMKILEHEYKVMGLAPYAKAYYLDTYERIFADVVHIDPDNPLTFSATVDSPAFYEYLIQHAVGERFDNIAGAIQHLLEERVTEWVRNAIAATGIRRVFTGGGVFMNVKLNKRLQEMPEVQRVSFLPSCGDESNPMGAAYQVFQDAGIKPSPLSDLYLGPDFGHSEIEAYIAEAGLEERFHVSRPDDMEDHLAGLLADGAIVARFAGRCEWGARSLGNRAILAHPSHMESFYTVNDQIKARDFWMPFAPSVLQSRAAEYLLDYDPDKAQAPHMITAFDASPAGVESLRAALHQGDHTLRPQVVTAEANPGYHRLISAFERRTGVGALLNTSFNLHGKPLVARPEQALATLDNSGLRHLALGHALVSKR